MQSQWTMYKKNHTDVQINSTAGSQDVCHDWIEVKNIPQIETESKILVIGGDIQRPWFAKKRYMVLSAMFGMNWRVRDILDEKSDCACYTFEKEVTDVHI